ncbi:MAG: IS21 family transposase [Candidatus Aminicenantes bacterium]|nr:IS21 family transposase [Candidatus Aminicenantes bacterium]
MDETLRIEVRRLREVEGLTMRQIAAKLRMGRKTVSRILGGEPKPRRKPLMIAPYERLIAEWYQATPALMAIQVLHRLRGYGYTGGYGAVKQATMGFRKKRKAAFFELAFLPGEEAQVDWMEWKIGEAAVYGFVYILAWSRYAVVCFYPRHTLEFFLDGHIRAFHEIGGVAHRHRYDNLKSVVIRRTPEVQFNPAFLDFARHYGFSIHACNVARANEKGRVERIIRDCKGFLRVTPITSLLELNARVFAWQRERNLRVHRTTQRPPAEMLREEKLRPLPRIDARPYRRVPAAVSKTAFVEFDTNRYSVPTAYAGLAAEILALPDTVEVLVQGKRVAGHPRIFTKHDKSELPAHREGLLLRSPRAKFERIYNLMAGLGPEIKAFLENTRAEGEDAVQAAYVLFRLLRGLSKETLLSAVREANALKVYKIKYVHSLLERAGAKEPPTVRPQDERLLEIAYEARRLDDYDDLI